MANGDLMDGLSRRNPITKLPMMSWKIRIQIAADIAEGMEFLHSRKPPIIHRDLKSANVLLDIEDRAKIADFGLSRFAKAQQKAAEIVRRKSFAEHSNDMDILASARSKLTNELITPGEYDQILQAHKRAGKMEATVYGAEDSNAPDMDPMQSLDDDDNIDVTKAGGTTFYMSPESFGSRVKGITGTKKWLAKYDKSVDVYAYAIVLLELITCRTPWEEESYVRVKSKVEAGERPFVKGMEYQMAMSNNGGRVMVELMHMCWEQNPKDRPSFTKVLCMLRKVESVAMMYEEEHNLHGAGRRSSSYRSPSSEENCGESGSGSSSYPLSSSEDKEEEEDFARKDERVKYSSFSMEA